MAENDLQSIAFPTLDEAQITRLSACTAAAPGSYKDGQTLFAVGDRNSKFFVVKSGEVEIIDYSGQDLRERVKALTGGEGLDVCVENVGGTLFTTLARLMRWNGRLMPIGFTSGPFH